jgi:hypothetical protein
MPAAGDDARARRAAAVCTLGAAAHIGRSLLAVGGIRHHKVVAVTARCFVLPPQRVAARLPVVVRRRAAIYAEHCGARLAAYAIRVRLQGTGTVEFEWHRALRTSRQLRRRRLVSSERLRLQRGTLSGGQQRPHIDSGESRTARATRGELSSFHDAASKDGFAIGAQDVITCSERLHLG